MRRSSLLWGLAFKSTLWMRVSSTAHKMKFSIKDFFRKCDQISKKLRIWSHLLKNFLMENFIFCAVFARSKRRIKFIKSWHKSSNKGGSPKKKIHFSKMVFRIMHAVRKHVSNRDKTFLKLSLQKLVLHSINWLHAWLYQTTVKMFHRWYNITY